MSDLGNKRILVEDDYDIARLVTIHLSQMGFEVEHQVDGETGLAMALENNYCLAVVDVMLPSLDGLELCKRLRSSGSYVPVLMLTCKSDEIDKVVGLEVGADDYMTKPFSIHELIARVKALLRRATMHSQTVTEVNRTLHVGNLRIDPDKRRVHIEDVEVSLTVKEFELLHLLVSNPGKSFSRGDLLDRIWDYHSSAYEHTVTSHINRLRNKIEKDARNPRYLMTVWGYGYRFVDPEKY